MTRYGLICLLFCAMANGQVAQSTPAGEEPATPPNSARAPVSSVAPDTPVITIEGVCDHPSGEKPPANCKKVITRAQFESMVQTVQPGLSANARREFARKYVSALVTEEKVREMGLDQGARFELRSKIARTQALAQELSVVVYDNGSKVSDKEIEEYYRQNPDRYVEADLTRMLVPGIQQLPAPTETLSEAAQAKRNQDSEAIMKAEAEKLRVRAVSGEPLDKLQSEAFELAMVKDPAPSSSLGKVRGEDLPSNLLVVMELKTGEVSDLILDKAGYVIYKMGAKRTLPLEEVRDNVRKSLADQHRKAEMDAILNAAKTSLDEVYFGK